MKIELWEAYAWQLDEPQPHHTEPSPLDTAVQRAYRLSTVESDLADDELLADWHRGHRA